MTLVSSRAGHQVTGPDATARHPRWASISGSSLAHQPRPRASRRCRSRTRPYYATYLAKRIGFSRDVGLAEDTWALNEGVTDDGTFLQQAYDIDKEREGDVFRRARWSFQARQPGLRVRRHRSDPAHVLAGHRSGASGGTRPQSCAATATPFANSTRTTTPMSWSAGSGRRSAKTMC